VGEYWRIWETLMWWETTFGFFLSLGFILSFQTYLFSWFIFNDVFLCCFWKMKRKFFLWKRMCIYVKVMNLFKNYIYICYHCLLMLIICLVNLMWIIVTLIYICPCFLDKFLEHDASCYITVIGDLQVV